MVVEVVLLMVFAAPAAFGKAKTPELMGRYSAFPGMGKFVWKATGRLPVNLHIL